MLFNHFKNDTFIQGKVNLRKKFLFTSHIGLAYLLTPKFAADGFYFDDDKLNIIQSAIELAKKLFTEDEEKIAFEINSFVSEMCAAKDEGRSQTVLRMNAEHYWNIVGREKYPIIYKLAKPITAMIASSATAERVWSTFRFIHSRLRNRLLNERVDKLVFIYTNCVLLDIIDQNDYILDEGAILNGNEL